MTTLERIREKVVEAVPEIMEPAFGIRAIYTDPVKPSPRFSCEIIGRTASGSIEVRIGHHYSFVKDSELEIIGRPITLADVLRAAPVGVYLKTLGDQVRLVLDNEDDGENAECCFWDLTLPLEGQSEETLEFIAKVLNV